MAKKRKATVINPITDQEISLTPELIKQAASLFRSGMTETTLAGLLGVRPVLFREWLVRGGVYNTGLHGQLFRECFKNLSSVELEHLNNIRVHALGQKAEFAYDEVIHPDGRIEKKIARDKEGNPIIIRAEIKPNPQWSSWILSKRFKTTYGIDEQHKTFIDEVNDNAALNNNDSDGNAPIDVTTISEQDHIEMMELYINEKKAIGLKNS